MAKKIKRQLGDTAILNCACLIHDTLYSLDYVDKLYNSICRNVSTEVKMHVFTEGNRSIPGHYVKHVLEEWKNIRGPKSSWWYKIQIFNPENYSGPLLYFDLDTVIVNNIDWIWNCPSNYFWSIKDFKYLFRNKGITINSSVMWFDTNLFSHVYNDFDHKLVSKGAKRWHGDQDYIDQAIPIERKRTLDPERIVSYKWQAHDGGYDFAKRRSKSPGQGTTQHDLHSVYVFHGNPKPHQCLNDPVVQQHWR